MKTPTETLKQGSNEAITDQNKPSKGKWLSIYVEPEELFIIEGIQSRIRDYGLTMSLSKVLRQFMSIGFQNTDKDVIVLDPLRFFYEGGER